MSEQTIGLVNWNIEGIRSSANNIKRKRSSYEVGLSSDFMNLKRILVSGGSELDHGRRISKSCFPVGLREIGEDNIDGEHISDH